MTRSTHILPIGRTLLLAAILALALSTGTHPAGAACSDTAERYPMLIGSGYEGAACDAAGSALDAAARSTSRVALSVVALATASPAWHETMLDGSGYEGHAIDTALSDQDRD